MSRPPFDTSFPPPTKSTLICSSQLQPLPSGTRLYISVLKPRPIERSYSLLLWMPVLGAAVSRGQQARYAHSSYGSLMPEVAYCQSHLFFCGFSIIDFPFTTCVVCRSWRATLPGVDPLLRV